MLPQNEPLTDIQTIAKVHETLLKGHRKKKIQRCTGHYTGLGFISTDVDAVGGSCANFFARFSDQHL